MENCKIKKIGFKSQSEKLELLVLCFRDNKMCHICLYTIWTIKNYCDLFLKNIKELNN